MRRIGRTAVLFFIAVVLLTGTAFANSAPPDYLLVVKLINGPGEPYDLDILSEKGGNSDDFHVNGGQVEEGGVHRFSGLGTPQRFRIRIVTESGEAWESDILERRVLQDAVTVDWATKQVFAAPIWLAVALQTLSTLLPTLAVEGLLLLAFRFDWKKNWKPFLLVNLVTQGALAVFLSTNIVRSGLGSYGMILYGVLLIPVELVIAFVEAALYAKLFQGKSGNRAFAYGLTANVVSYLLGLFTVPAVWEGFVRALWLGV